MKALGSLCCLLVAACATGANSTPGSQASASRSSAAVPGETTEVLPLQFAAAQDLAATLNALELSDPPTRVLADTRTNSLIVQGPKVGLTRVHDLVSQLDVKARRD
ncbi:MAG: hypothetical protein L6Q99_13840 [Planctomycetes bacterium]|nr:hypothetical protein [Planctomycetota bacterium]